MIPLQNHLPWNNQFPWMQSLCKMPRSFETIDKNQIKPMEKLEKLNNE
jgi:hypothetical protein